MNSLETVTIQRVDNFAWISDRFTALLTPCLESTRNEFAVGEHGSIRRNAVVEQHYQFWEGHLFFSTGSLDRVQQRLVSAGYQVTIEEYARWRHLETADTSLIDSDEFTPTDQEYLLQLSRAPRGQVILRSSDQVPRHIALLALLFSESRILVVAHNVSARDRLARQIANYDCPVTIRPRAAFNDPERVLVVALQLGRYTGGADFDLIVYADRESALMETTNEFHLLSRWPCTSWYSIRHDYYPGQVREEFLLEELFWPVIYSAREHSSQERPVQVVFQPGPDTHKQQKLPPLARKRELYWQNQEWNRHILQLAERNATSEGSRSAILVECEEHGRELLRLDPNRELKTVNDVNDEVEWLTAITGGEIGTFAVAAKYGVCADVVVRADGGPGWPLADALNCRMLQVDDPVLLIDVRDQRDPQAARDTASRQEAYTARSWEWREVERDGDSE